MADPTSDRDDLFAQWRKQVEAGTDAWIKTVRQMASQGQVPPPPDPAQFWRQFSNAGPFNASPFTGAGPIDPEVLAQWKRFLDDWIAAWSRALEQAMGTEAFAEALGKTLDQFLTVQGKARQAVERSGKAAIDAVGLPSREQVVGLSRQMMDLDDRLEAIQDRLEADKPEDKAEADKLEAIESRLGGLEDKLGRLEGLENKLGGLDDKLEGLGDRLEGLGDRLEGLDDKLGALGNRPPAAAPDAGDRSQPLRAAGRKTAGGKTGAGAVKADAGAARPGASAAKARGSAAKSGGSAAKSGRGGARTPKRRA